MSRLRRAFAGIAPLLLLAAAPADAVGLGPLSKEGVTDGPKKAFWLTILNPYQEALPFTAEPVDLDDEAHPARVRVIPPSLVLGAGRNARLLVIAGDLQPAETYRFRVCAQRAQPPAGVTINARVCSKLTARRVP